MHDGMGLASPIFDSEVNMRTLSRHSRRGFTLVELVIAVAVVGILAAIAIPSWREMQARAKHAEAYDVLEGVRRSVASFDDSTGPFVGNPDYCPDGNPGRTTRGQWADNPKCTGFTGIALNMSGELYGSYRLVPTTGDCYLAEAIFDVDGDGVLATFSVDCHGVWSRPVDGAL